VGTRADDLAALERALGARARRDHPLGAGTTYRVGGTATLFVEPEDEDELVAMARSLAGLDVPVLVVGKGSNLLVADRGFDGLAVSLGQGFETLSACRYWPAAPPPPGWPAWSGRWGCPGRWGVRSA
jgi:hypothetical protein